MSRHFLPALLLATAAVGAAPHTARAAEVIFSGSMLGTSTSVLAPDCAPLLRRSTLLGSGSSSLGSFDYQHAICLSGVGPLTNGTFLFSFADGSTLNGTLAGLATVSGTPSVSNISLSYLILGGTGLFDGATGGFNGVGTVDQRNLPTTTVQIAFSAVPEPGTWAMMLVGFGAVGFGLRRRSSAIARAVAL